MAVAVGRMRMSSNNGSDLYSFFHPKSGIVNSITTKNDADGSRRKRQRTTSPIENVPSSPDVALSSWQNQLRVAAYGERMDPTEIPELAMTSSTTAEQHNFKEHEDAAAYSGPGIRNVFEEKGLATPPKKMLKVRPDGKLVSPKSRDTICKPVRGSRKKSAKIEIDKKQMLVILKYGKDEDSRKATAQKIEGICLPTDCKQSNALDTAQPTPVTAGPPKPTHPFFLGPLARTSDQQSPAAERQADNPPDGDSDRGDAKTKHSPRKIVAANKAGVNGNTWANIGGFDARPSGFGSLRTSRFPEAIDPILPPQGMVHVGRETNPDLHNTNTPEFPQIPPKMKDAAVQISEREEFLRPYVDLVKSCRDEMNRSHNAIRRGRSLTQHPVRRIMTGPELQLAVRQKVSCGLPMPKKCWDLDYKDDSSLDSLKSSHAQVHHAVLQAYENLEGSLTAFDKFECETQDWVHKYGPKSAEQVLQQGPEAMLLRDWLKRLTVTSVASQKGDSFISTNPLKKASLNSRRKRQRKAEDLEGFVISSDEELDRMDELVDTRLDDPDLQASWSTKRSVLRSGDMLGPTNKTGSSGRATNAVVISGPHGCGKTAAVYAVAKELDFEVFEITAGSRRSGKDLLDKVGDMTRNHLVTRSHEVNDSNGDEGDKPSEDISLVSDALQQDLESGRQGTMHLFLRPDSENKKKLKQKAHKKGAGQQSKEKPNKSPNQKQSVILLEEVDVLFEEDKQFWATTLELILQSKRPIIMTCTDESLLPLNDLPLHAILRFTPSPESLTTDYLMLMACNEGHLLSRKAVSTLYKCKGHDLRASITELNFFCQMALGDTKAGLGWMLIRSSPQECQNEKGEALRVISEDTYLEGMGWATCEDQELGSENRIDAQSDVLGEVLRCWSLDTADCEELVPRKLLASQDQGQRDERLRALEDLDQAFDALSVADAHWCQGGLHHISAIDPAQPHLTEKSRLNYVEGSILLQADPPVEPTGLATSFALALTVCTGVHFAHTNIAHSLASLTKKSCIDVVCEHAQRSRNGYPVTRSSLCAAFAPITSSPKALVRGPYISTFDNTTSVIVEEVAPYVRSIVSYDMTLEEQRLRLNSLLSDGARNGKRIRTTRASRAALEGGNKANTRRERWFPESLSFPLVLRTGGRNWQSTALQRTSYQGSEEDLSPGTSRRASVGSMMESES